MSSERCEVTDLIKSQCAHCNPEPKPATRRKPVLGPIVEARHIGFCGVCDEQIEVGDAIGLIMDSPTELWAHYGCGV